MDFQNYVDRILNVYKDGRARHLNGVIRETIHELKGKDEESIFIKYLEEKRLLERAEGYNEWHYAITTFGYEIITSGGWLIYLSTIENEHNELIQLREKNEKAEKARFRVNTIIAVIGLILLAIPIYQTGKLNRQNEVIEEINKSNDSLLIEMNNRDSLVKTRDKSISEMKESLDSLADKLKTKK